MKKIITVSFLFLLACTTITSCKKKNDDTDSTNSNPCNFTTNVISVDGSVKNIVKSDCKIFGTNYYSEHLTDTSATPEGTVMVFNGSNPPAAGTYTAVNTIALVAAGTVYVEYYKIADSWQPATGSVTVTDNGASKVYSFCNFTCTQSGANAKKVSVRATCN